MEKPKIQYIGQFYIDGTVAKQVEFHSPLRRPKTTLPQSRPNRVKVHYIEPTVIISLVLIVAMVLSMGLGLLQIQEDWQQYEQMKNHVSDLRLQNAELQREYRAAYDLADVESKALGLGMIPMEEATHITVSIISPMRVEVPELTWVQEMTLFWTNLWE